MKGYLYFATLFATALLLLFADFFSKAYIFHVLPVSEDVLFFSQKKVEVFNDFLGIDFALNLTLNKGAAWGLLSNFQLPLEILRIIVAVALVIFMIFFPHDRKKDIPLLLIIVGAFGNIIDFFLYGSVVDFFHFTFFGYHFPIFNVADIMITIGVATLFLLVSRKKENTSDATS